MNVSCSLLKNSKQLQFDRHVRKRRGEDTDDTPENILLEKYHTLKFASVTVFLVKRSFSAYKGILSDRCRVLKTKF